MSDTEMPERIKITAEEAVEIRAMKFDCDIPWWAKHYCLDCGMLLITSKNHSHGAAS